MSSFYSVKNQKGNENLISNHYEFNIYLNKDGVETWRCINKSCRVLGHVNLENSFILHKRHNHDDEKAKIIRKKLLETVVKEALETGCPTLEVITKNTALFEGEEVGELYSYKYMADQINTEKNSKYFPTKIKLDDIPEFLKKDLYGNLFLTYDNMDEKIGLSFFFQNFHVNIWPIMKLL